MVVTEARVLTPKAEAHEWTDSVTTAVANILPTVADGFFAGAKVIASTTTIAVASGGGESCVA